MFAAGELGRTTHRRMASLAEAAGKRVLDKPLLENRFNHPYDGVIEDALREVVARRKNTPQVKKTRLITDGGKGLRPGVCLDNNAQLLDIMEGRSIRF